MRGLNALIVPGRLILQRRSYNKSLYSMLAAARHRAAKQAPKEEPAQEPRWEPHRPAGMPQKCSREQVPDTRASRPPASDPTPSGEASKNPSPMRLEEHAFQTHHIPQLYPAHKHASASAPCPRANPQSNSPQCSPLPHVHSSQCPLRITSPTPNRRQVGRESPRKPTTVPNTPWDSVHATTSPSMYPEGLLDDHRCYLLPTPTTHRTDRGTPATGPPVTGVQLEVGRWEVKFTLCKKIKVISVII